MSRARASSTRTGASPPWWSRHEGRVDHRRRRGRHQEAKQRRREERERSAARNRYYTMTRHSHVSIKDAAWQHMEQAYMKSSANSTLPALARQVMYAARPLIQETADRELGKDFDKYFTQSLLPNYAAE